jgi:hypothetical protein
MDELAMDLATKRVHHRYLKVLVIAKAAVADMLGKLLAVLNRFGIAFEFDADPVPHWNPVFHIEKKCLHGQSAFV